MVDAMQLHLTTSASSYKPGDTVIALLQVSSGNTVVELQEVELQFSGIERVDTSWVSPSYRKDVSPINTDKRHLQRYTVQSRLQAATQGTLGGAKDRKFVVRFTLPATLPPSFRGTAVRVSYSLQASVTFQTAQAGSSSGSSTPGASQVSYEPSEAPSEQQAPQLQETVTADGLTTSTVQLPIHIWPSKAEHDGAAAASAEPLPLITSEDMPIKCWEIGPGTGVQEAIAHISRLLAQPAAAASSGGGGGAGTGRGSPSDDVGDSSASDGAGEEDDEDQDALPPQRRSSSLPISRQATADSERVLPTPSQHLQLDPSAVLRSYALRIGEHAIARVSLHPPVEGTLHPGATLAGTLELLHPGSSSSGGGEDNAGGESGSPPPAAAAPAVTPGVPRCMQVLILLETEERVSPQWRLASKAGAAGGVIRRVYDEQLDLTADMASTHFVFTLPPDSQSNFVTPLLALQWVLRFQFTASTPRAAGVANPLQGKIDQLTWALPLHVGAPQ